MTPGLGRREFLRLTGTASLALAMTAPVAGWLTGCSGAAPPAQGYRHLRASDVALLAPLVPVALAGALPEGTDPERPLEVLDGLLHHFSPGGRKALFQLLDLLQLAPARWYLTGTWAAFGEQGPDELKATLTAWSRSDSGFARVAHNAAIRPMMIAWYSEPGIGRTTGYPGPPEKVV
jgi:hypothetical protein